MKRGLTAAYSCRNNVSFLSGSFLILSLAKLTGRVFTSELVEAFHTPSDGVCACGPVEWTNHTACL